MQKFLYISGAFSGFLAVAVGAFGAHGLKTILEKYDRVQTFNTGVEYHFYHTFALFVVGVLMNWYDSKLLHYAGYSFLGGIVLFSGSLYILSLTNIGKLGAITPFGGLLFLSGWILIFLGVYKG